MEENLEDKIRKAERIVVKYGSDTVIDETGSPSYQRLKDWAKTIRDYPDKEFVIASSGAIPAGREKAKKFGFDPSKNPQDLATKQYFASIGQSELMRAYDYTFSQQGILVSQILLDNNNFTNSIQRQNLYSTLQRTLQNGTLPIINENDTVSTEEIQFGDNDHLAALTARKLNADLLILMTKEDGIYEDMESRKVIPFIGDERYARTLVDDTAISTNGTGGMTSKINSAATFGGLTIIANGREYSSLRKTLEGENIGTRLYFGANSK